MNNLSLIGRLTRDPETKFTQSGKAITSFSIAFDVGWGDKKRSVFLDCKIWGERGENLAKFVSKGHRVGLVGLLDQDEWDDKATGEKKKKFVFDVRDFTLIERKAPDDEAPSPRQQARPAPRPNAARPKPPGTIEYEQPDASQDDYTF